MASATTAAPERPTLTLSSNNPFRNRATSPSPQTLAAPVAPRVRPVSTNPFLDDSDFSSQPGRANVAIADIPVDLFNSISLDKPSPKGPPPPYKPGPSRTTNERRDHPRGPPRKGERSEKRDHGSLHQRRASESSVMDSRDRRPREERDRSARPQRTESEERRRRERRKEREEHHRREKEKEKGKKPRKPQGLDLIDKLDVTGIYGQGHFHHDGPFDACNPHRNAKKDRRAPMQAFPADSANMALGGSGPVRTKLDLDAYHGRGVEGFSEYASARKAAEPMSDTTRKWEQVHGEETSGLGTSTFLEGAPASRSAVKRNSEEGPSGIGGTLSRKKSLAQRFRGMSGTRRHPSEVRSPVSQYGRTSDELDDSPPAKIKASSAGGMTRAKYNKENEINPFDNDYEAAFDRKGAQIKIAEQQRPSSSRQREPPSPKRGALTRTVTLDAQSTGSSNDDDKPGSSSFLDRMKSLKTGPRKTR